MSRSLFNSTPKLFNEALSPPWDTGPFKSNKDDDRPCPGDWDLRKMASHRSLIRGMPATPTRGIKFFIWKIIKDFYKYKWALWTP